MNTISPPEESALRIPRGDEFVECVVSRVDWSRRRAFCLPLEEEYARYPDLNTPVKVIVLDFRFNPLSFEIRLGQHVFLYDTEDEIEWHSRRARPVRIGDVCPVIASQDSDGPVQEDVLVCTISGFLWTSEVVICEPVLNEFTRRPGLDSLLSLPVHFVFRSWSFENPPALGQQVRLFDVQRHDERWTASRATPDQD